MSVDVELQIMSSMQGLPQQADFLQWINAAAGERDTEVVVRIVDEPESRELNANFRGKDKPTNVLSFPFEAPEPLQELNLPDINILGDLVICAPVIIREAIEQGKDASAHWAHMAIHGTLHLLGYDHQSDTDAAEMEDLEKQILTGLGFSAPYQDDI